MQASTLNLPRQRPAVFLLVAALVWWLLYQALLPEQGRAMVARLSGRGRLALLAAGLVVSMSLPLPAVAQTGTQLASDKGCYNCHGNPPRKNTPRFTDLALRYAPYKSRPDEARALAEQLRKGSFLEHVDAHERLSAETPAALVHWIIDGAR